MLLLIAALSINLDLTALLRSARHTEPPTVRGLTCNISTVSYRFSGAPGTTFRYDGESFTVPKSGSIELIAAKGKSNYEINGKTLPLDVWPKDDFGCRNVPLPQPQQ